MTIIDVEINAYDSIYTMKTIHSVERERERESREIRLIPLIACVTNKFKVTWENVYKT